MERVERMLLSLHRGMTISVHYQRLLLSWNGRARLLAGADLGHFPGYVNGQTAFGTVLFPLGLRCPYGFRAHHIEAGLSFTATATTNDAGGLIVLGERWEQARNSSASRVAAWVLKLDAGMGTVWTKTYTYGTDRHTLGTSLARSSDGGYVIAGCSGFIHDWHPDYRKKLWLMKTDGDGSPLWQYVSGGTGIDEGNSVVSAADGGFVVAGTTNSMGAGLEDVHVIKVDGSGNLLWERTFGGTQADAGACIAPSPDGGFAIAESTEVPGALEQPSHFDVYLVKIDGLGNKIWEKTYGGPKDDCAYGIAPASGGGYVVVGTTESYGPAPSNAYVMKIDESGELWEAP